MAVFKCKMCGGDLNIVESTTVIECEYCGTRQTVSCSDDEKRINLYNRANRLRINGEFDKAANIYESIVAEFPDDAEAYWGLVICNYGIEYVDDPATAKKIPTCHRASFESIQNDENYKMALECADVIAQKVYRDEAREIDRIREEILTISKNEKPYDIFICYKETNEKGERTIDSVIAQDVYDALTDKGYKVFFSRISLEDKLGRQYEPYIFAALNSAKIMLAFGTKYEFFHAVWVKNEWSRFLKLMAKDKSKVLIPCYKDIDAYDMPDEFKALQAQDMGKVGAIQDLIRGIGKILEINAVTPKNDAPKEFDAVTASLLKRAFMFLEDGNFASANEYCEKVLDINPECAEAYLGKLMAECKVSKESQLADFRVPFYNSDNYQKILRFGDAKMSERIMSYCDAVTARKQNEEKEMLYNNVSKGLNNAKTINDYIALSKVIEKILDYKDAAVLQKRCQEQIDLYNKELSYNKAQKLLQKSKSIDDVKEAEKLLTEIIDFKNSRELVDNDCKKIIQVYELCDAFRELLKENKSSDVDDKMESLKREKGKLLQIIPIFNENFEELVDIEKKIEEYTEQLEKPSEQKSFFGFKKKTVEIDYHNEIEVLTARKAPIVKKIGAYKSIDEINLKISNIDKQIEELKSEAGNGASSVTSKDMDAIADKLCSDELKPFVSKTPYASYIAKISLLKIFSHGRIGDVVTFGKYKGESIYWQILDKKDSKFLLFSIDCIDCLKFNNWFGNTSWNHSTIRQYLNYEFYKEVFSNDERSTIVPSEQTSDKIFLFSVDEVKQYLPTHEERKTRVTSYLRRMLPFGANKCRWWLRTNGAKESEIAFVDADGSIDYNGDIATTQYNAIRPAMWIELNEK